MMVLTAAQQAGYRAASALLPDAWSKARHARRWHGAEIVDNFFEENDVVRNGVVKKSHVNGKGEGLAEELGDSNCGEEGRELKLSVNAGAATGWRENNGGFDRAWGGGRARHTIWRERRFNNLIKAKMADAISSRPAQRCTVSKVTVNFKTARALTYRSS